MKLYKPGKQRGIGLLELMLSLAIIAVLLVMVTRYYVVAKRSQEVNQMATLVGALEGAVANWKAGQANYSGVTWAKLNDLGLLTNADYDGTTVRTPWGTKVSLSAGDSYVEFKAANLEVKACASLGAKFDNSKGGCDKTTFTYIIGTKSS